MKWLQTEGGSFHTKTEDDAGNVIAASVAEDMPGKWSILVRWDKPDVGACDPPGRWSTADEARAVVETMLSDLPRLEKDIRWNKANPVTGLVEGWKPW